MSNASRALAVERLACPLCQGPFLDEVRRLRCCACGHTLAFDDQGILLASPESNRPLTMAQRIGQWPWAARAYDAWRRRSLTLLSGEPFSVDRERHLLFGELPLGGARVYLDNATATGYLGRALARRLATTEVPFVVIANDLSLPMLRRAVELARRDGSAEHLFFVHAASEHLPLQPRSLDGILCGGTLNEFTDAERVMQEWARVLSASGVVSVMLQTRAPGWRGWVQAELGRRLGLTIESARRFAGRFETFFHTKRQLSFGPILFLSGGHRPAAAELRSQAA